MYIDRHFIYDLEDAITRDDVKIFKELVLWFEAEVKKTQFVPIQEEPSEATPYPQATDSQDSSDSEAADDSEELYYSNKIFFNTEANITTIRFAKNDTAYHRAAQYNAINVLKFLIQHNVTGVEIQNNLGYRPLHQAADSNRPECIKLLAKDGCADIDAKIQLTGKYNTGIIGHTPLHIAARFGNTRAVVALIECGANINTLTERHQTALTLCDNSNCMRELLNAKANIQGAIDEFGNTLLHVAARRNYFELIPQFIQLGLGVDCLNSDNQTAAHIAAINRNHRCLEALLANGANIHLKDSHEEGLYETLIMGPQREFNQQHVKNSVIAPAYACSIDLCVEILTRCQCEQNLDLARKLLEELNQIINQAQASLLMYQGVGLNKGQSLEAEQNQVAQMTWFFFPPSNQLAGPAPPDATITYTSTL